MSPLSDHPMKLLFGIRFKVIIGVVIIMVMIMTGMTFVLIEKSREDLLYQMEKRGVALLSYVERSIRIELDRHQTGDDDITQTLKDAISLFNADPDLEALMVVGESRMILAHTDETKVGRYYLGNDLPGRKDFVPHTEQQAIVKTEGSKKERMIIFEPLYYQGRFIGILRAAFSLASVSENLAVSRKGTVKVIFVETVVIIIFISLLLTMMVARPIERLARITSKIASGDLHTRVEVVSRDEFGYLAQAFNRMTEQLQFTHNSLENTIQLQEEAYRELEATQDRLIASEKLASVGRLAAGVAHEIGNPLASISGYTDILLMGDISQQELQEYATKIQHALERIRKIIRELLDFSRPTPLELHPVNLKDVLSGTILLAAHHPAVKSYKIRVEGDDDLPPILADEHALSQVFLNVLINAGQAVNERFRGISAPTETQQSTDIVIKIEPLISPTRGNEQTIGDGELILGEGITFRAKSGHFLAVSFIDHGTGIDPKDLKQIFDPFFTTKKESEGSGLGLTISHTIIERLNGKIDVSTQRGVGTTFTITLPVAEVVTLKENAHSLEEQQ